MSIFIAKHSQITDSNIHIMLIVALAVYCLIKWAGKKYFPDVDEKKRETITFAIPIGLFMLAVPIYYTLK